MYCPVSANFECSLAIMNSCAESMASVVRAVSVPFQLTRHNIMKNISGRHNCLWCLITSSRLKEPLAQRGRLPERSLDSLTSDHSKFVSSGGDIRNAKSYNNVIENYFFDIPLENVGEYAVNITYI